MSLDERLRGDLRRMAEPVQDTQRALEAFREHAYPRRARRRIIEGIGATLAAAALIAGVTATLLNSTRKASFIIPGPGDAPLCRASDVQAVTEGLDHNQFGLGFISSKATCRIDETVAPKVTSNRLSFVTTAPVHLLDVRGNGGPVKFTGIVSPGSELSIVWTWTNWCGPDRSFSLSFNRISGLTDLGNDEPGNYGSFATVPPCHDPSKPSVMSAGPATLTPLPSGSSSSAPVYDHNPHIITPRSGLTNLVRSPINQILVRPDDKTLIVSFTHSVGCRLFARIEVQQDAHGVTIGIYVGDLPGSQSACDGEVVYSDAAMVELDQPLGNRPIYDATYPQNLGVPVYHVKS